MSEAPSLLLTLLIGSGGLGMAGLAGMLAALMVAFVHIGFLAPSMLPRRAATTALLLALGLIGISLLLAVFMATPVPVLPAIAALWAAHLGRKLRRTELPKTTAVVPPSSSRTAAGPDAFARQLQADRDAAARGAAKPDVVTLGRYRIDREIGRGAMGAVYLGHDPKISRQVAIKTLALAQEFDGDELTEARRRFFREAETAGRLQHPGIVAIFDVGEEGDLAYIAMEYVRGHDLQRHTKSGALLPVGQVLRIVAVVADALAYAHSQGVVHRDIKPANVMVELDAQSRLIDGTVKVTDFGIARVADAARTRTGLVLGTPSFMSPEQMAGQRVDGRSDLYSLGVMLFQLLTGGLPHRADSMAKLMSQIANDRAPDVRSMRAELPASIAAIVSMALEKKPDARYADGRRLAAELRAVAEQLGPTADLAPGAVADGSAPPNSDAFAATVKLSRHDPGHNSTL